MEKERYRFFETAIQDTKYQNTDVPQSLMDKTLCCIRLNEQDARIKELYEKLAKCEKDKQMWQDMYKDADRINKNICETDIYPLQEENQQLKQQLSLKMEELHIAYCGIENVKTKNGNLKEEIKQLKQSQKQLAIEELERVQVQCQFDITFADYEQEQRLYDYINNQIKSLKGEE